jgi:type VI secretion system protein ImpJ
VFLAVPMLQTARANVADRNAASARYVVDTQDLEDENTGQNPQSVHIRRLNIKLLVSGQDQSGYEVLPIARIKKADRAEATPQLDESYIPPLLACDAWKPLHDGILEQVYDRIGKKLELLSSQVVSRSMTFDSQGQGDRLIFEQLRVMNQAQAPLQIMSFAPGVHPLAMYLELCRVVGGLAIFGAERRPPELPRYDHDELGTCFWRVKQYIDALLDIVVEPDYKERPFVGAGLRMQVALEPVWIESRWRMLVGVQSSLPAEQCARLVTSGLDMKIGSSDRVDETFRLGEAGLRFSYTNTPPRALPAQPGLIYFQVDRSTQPEEWEKVQRSLTLALRLNENLIVSNIQGQRTLNIKVGGQATALQFTLYVVAQDKV